MRIDGLQYGQKPLHFPFLEGQFSAAGCRACGHTCCESTQSITLSASQADLVEFFGGPAAVIARDPGAIHIDTSEGCPALQRDGLCSLHAERGLRGKPALCALFPYVSLTDHGTFISVAPNLAYVCPLSAELRHGEPRTAFADLASDLEHFFPDGTAQFTSLPVHATQPVQQAEESEIVVAAHALRGRGDFADVLREVRGPGARAAVDESRTRIAKLWPALQPSPDLDFYQEALPLVGILRTWLFAHPLHVVDAATDLSLRSLARRRRRRLATKGSTEAQYIARCLQQALPRVLRLVALSS